MRKDIRLDMEIVTPEKLIDIQKKLNNWITNGTLVKFETQPLPNGNILFKIIRTKEV
jgi:hypothetical protein